jgi:hypothetical protein
MHRFRISLGISLLLLFAQQGAIVHEIGHMSRVGHVEVRIQPDVVLEKSCELCLGFSQLATPASHTVQIVTFEPGSCAAGFLRICAANPTDLPTPRNRGPPLSS